MRVSIEVEFDEGLYNPTVAELLHAIGEAYSSENSIDIRNLPLNYAVNLRSEWVINNGTLTRVE